MLDTNPARLQDAPITARNATPLFLLHDGGGTIFNYFLLGELDRAVYGIHDPKFYTDDGWKGGLDEMARLYVTLIESVVQSGPILLGGKYKLHVHKQGPTLKFSLNRLVARWSRVARSVETAAGRQ
jgi:hypothetical protein